MEVELGTEKEKDGSSEVVRWERSLPRMVLRVLLVEADDSTRQIIAAFLRKCGYRVAAVPDGLKALEALKGRPHNIDLVLTEVELPSISGFALLTLVMERDACKNIPVIMMSSHDSISMVLKCMLKGAADFLIKPVRKNELRNLWQHVWRRLSLNGEHMHQNLPITQPKVEVTSENNTASNHSGDYATSTQKMKESSEKWSDVQSSCTTPYLEAESAYMQNMQGLSQLQCRSRISNLSNTNLWKHEEHVKSNEDSVMPESETGEKLNRLGSKVAPCSQAYRSTALRLEEGHACVKAMPQDEGMGPENVGISANVSIGIHGCDDERVDPSNGAIDLIGAFDNHSNCSYRHSSFNDGMDKLEFAPQLELSLRRFCPSASKDQVDNERHMLNHSNASTFSWYNNSQSLKPFFPALASNCTELKERAKKPHELLSSQLSQDSICTSQLHGAELSNSHENMTSHVIGQSGQVEQTYECPQLGLIPVPGVRFDNICARYSQVLSPIFYSQLGLPPHAWNPKPACLQELSPFSMGTSVHSNPDIHDSEQGCHQCDETVDYSIDQTAYEQSNIEPVKELKHGSPAAGHSTCTSLCDDVVSHDNSSAYGGTCRSDGNATSAAAIEKVTAPEILNDRSLFIHDGFKGMDSHHSSQREAALTKFRLKRKDRCYEKKVRYQTRKRLAEQRPRVKGQFVRQVQNDNLAANAAVRP